MRRPGIDTGKASSSAARLTGNTMINRIFFSLPGNPSRVPGAQSTPWPNRHCLPVIAALLSWLAAASAIAAPEEQLLGGCLVLHDETKEITLPAGVTRTCLARGREFDARRWRRDLAPLLATLEAAHALARQVRPGERPEILVLYHQAFPHAATLQTKTAVVILLDDGLLDRIERAVSALLVDWSPRLALPDRFEGPGLEDWLEILRTPVPGDIPEPRPEPQALRHAPERLAVARPWLVAALAFVLAHERAHAYSPYRTCGYAGLDPLKLEMACDRQALESFRATAVQERVVFTALPWLVTLGYHERYWHDRIQAAAARESTFGDQQDLLITRQWLERARALHALWKTWPRERHWPRALAAPLKAYLERILEGRAPVPASENASACRAGLHLETVRAESGDVTLKLRSEKLSAVRADVEVQWRAVSPGDHPPLDGAGKHYRVIGHAETDVRLDPRETRAVRISEPENIAPSQATGANVAARIFRCSEAPARRSPLFLDSPVR